MQQYSVIDDECDFKPPVEEISSDLEEFRTLVPIPGTAYTRAQCAGDAACACWTCIRELAEERETCSWKDEWFGIWLPSILMGGDDA